MLTRLYSGEETTTKAFKSIYLYTYQLIYLYTRTYTQASVSERSIDWNPLDTTGKKIVSVIVRVRPSDYDRGIVREACCGYEYGGDCGVGTVEWKEEGERKRGTARENGEAGRAAAAGGYLRKTHCFA